VSVPDDRVRFHSRLRYRSPWGGAPKSKNELTLMEPLSFAVKSWAGLNLGDPVIPWVDL